MSVRKPEMILIDVDGTLVDSVQDLAFCVDTMMEQIGRSPRGEAAVRNWVGNGVERLVSRALTGTASRRHISTWMACSRPWVPTRT